jgi:hypothetical protein
MPLVIPNISNDDKAAWANKLLGKKITDDTTDQMVGSWRLVLLSSCVKGTLANSRHAVLCQKGPS